MEIYFDIAMEQLIQALGYMSVIWVLLSWIKQFIAQDNIIQKYLCSKCITFWITLAISFNPFTASIAALMAAVLEVILSKIEIKL